LEKNIFEIDRKVDEDMLKVGNFIPMQNDQEHPLNWKVVEIKGENVIMDFNHPLAGKYLYFMGEIFEVREAGEEEMAHGHVHGYDTEH
jgi:FKBP-type peptidyl-prolyl cis-trans isomerase SlyD